MHRWNLRPLLWDFPTCPCSTLCVSGLLCLSCVPESLTHCAFIFINLKIFSILLLISSLIPGLFRRVLVSVHLHSFSFWFLESFQFNQRTHFPCVCFCCSVSYELTSVCAENVLNSSEKRVASAVWWSKFCKFLLALFATKKFPHLYFFLPSCWVECWRLHFSDSRTSCDSGIFEAMLLGTQYKECQAGLMNWSFVFNIIFLFPLEPTSNTRRLASAFKKFTVSVKYLFSSAGSSLIYHGCTADSVCLNCASYPGHLLACAPFTIRVYSERGRKCVCSVDIKWEQESLLSTWVLGLEFGSSGEQRKCILSSEPSRGPQSTHI